MKRSRIPALLLALVIVLAAPFTAAAKQWDYDDFTVEVPEDMYIFTPETSVSDPAWALAGITDPIETLNMYSGEEDGMNAIANFVSAGGDVNILVTRKASTNSQSVYNLGDLSDEEFDEFVSTLVGSEEESVTITADRYEHPEMPFFALSIDVDESAGTEMHERIYGTVLNGSAIAFTTYRQDTDITQEEMDVLDSIAQSFKVTKLVDKSELEAVDSFQVWGVIIFTGAVVLLIVGMIVFMKVRAGRDKKMKKQLADRLSEYRKTHGNGTEASGTMLYANSTDCSNEAIRAFSIYHAYVKNILPIAIGIVMSIAILVVTVLFRTDSDWWLPLIAAALVVYYAYKLITASSNVEKVQRKVYSMGVSTTAHYAFYEDAYRVSGIQSPATFPYFQMTDVCVSKEYIYIYYGPDNAYIINRGSFLNGASDTEFIKFIKSKLEKK